MEVVKMKKFYRELRSIVDYNYYGSNLNIYQRARILYFAKQKYNMYNWGADEFVSAKRYIHGEINEVFEGGNNE